MLAVKEGAVRLRDHSGTQVGKLVAELEAIMNTVWPRKLLWRQCCVAAQNCTTRYKIGQCHATPHTTPLYPAPPRPPCPSSPCHTLTHITSPNLTPTPTPPSTTTALHHTTKILPHPYTPLQPRIPPTTSPHPTLDYPAPPQHSTNPSEPRFTSRTAKPRHALVAPPPTRPPNTVSNVAWGFPLPPQPMSRGCHVANARVVLPQTLHPGSPKPHSATLLSTPQTHRAKSNKLLILGTVLKANHPVPHPPSAARPPGRRPPPPLCERRNLHWLHGRVLLRHPQAVHDM